MQKCSKGKLMALSSLSLGVSPAPFRCLLMFHDKSSQRFQRLRDFGMRKQEDVRGRTNPIDIINVGARSHSPQLVQITI